MPTLEELIKRVDTADDAVGIFLDAHPEGWQTQELLTFSNALNAATLAYHRGTLTPQMVEVVEQAADALMQTK